MRRVCRVMGAISFLLQATGVAADYTIEQIHFLPPSYYVGDEVEVRLRLSVDEGLVLAEPAELPTPTWIYIRDLRIIPISGQYDVRISFSAYETGTGELPPITLGDIVLKGVEISTESMLEEGTTRIEESFGPMLLPGTKLLLALAIGALIIAPIFLFFLIIWTRRFVAYVTVERRARKPIREFTLFLSELIDSDSPVDNKDFYARLTEIFKNYLSKRLGLNLRTLTASELRECLIERFAGNTSIRKISNELIRFDEVKFGNRRVNSPGRKGDIEKIREAVAAVEQWHQEAGRRVDS